MSNFIRVTPFICVDDLNRALAFFTDILGFTVPFHQGNYAYVHRETAAFRLLEQPGPDGSPPGNRRYAYYIDVNDVDKLYAELKPKLDTLPKNRFLKQSPPKFLWAFGVIVIMLIYLVIQAPRILGKPALTVISPAQSPFTTEANPFTLEGTARNADSLSLNGDSITIAPDGTWQKGVLLQNGLNSFQISAKKFLGGQTDMVEQIIYQPSGASSTASSTASSSLPAVHFESSTPATGTFYE